VECEWDEEKRRTNLEKQGLDFADVLRFDRRNPVFLDDVPIDGEIRQHAFGFLGIRLVFIAFTPRGGTCRMISTRNATRQEYRAYGKRT
jgi:uncharacterized DUF497 family protein